MHAAAMASCFHVGYSSALNHEHCLTLSTTSSLNSTQASLRCLWYSGLVGSAWSLPLRCVLELGDRADLILQLKGGLLALGGQAEVVEPIDPVKDERHELAVVLDATQKLLVVPRKYRLVQRPGVF